MDQTNHEKTPKKLLSFSGFNSKKKTPVSTTPKNFTTRFLLLSHNKAASLTPNRVVRNPFENHLQEKLHLPVISSPSMFNAPSTPKQQSKLELFEWTIEELSNLNPVNVTPHPTQFREEVDPAQEAQVQAAITTFFNEQQIVPSPAATEAYHLRKQKGNILMEIYNSTALPEFAQGCHSNNRDISTQTALSFPPNLPKEIEDLLEKYQLSEEACNNNDNVKDDLEVSNNDRSMMDISTLRRKLFINRPLTPENSDECFAVHLNLSPAPKTPELTRYSSQLNINNDEVLNDKDNDSISSGLFGELSPIANINSTCCSPELSSCNDVSMTSDVGRDQTPASRRCKKLKKTRLSESFCLLQNEFNDDSCNDDEEKENRNIQIMKNIPLTERKVFTRTDSGFKDDSISNQMNFSFSTEFMQI